MNQTEKRRSYIHPEGFKFAAISLSLSIILTTVSQIISVIFFMLTFFILWFFRDPKRNKPQDSNLIISSADGKVCLIDEAYPPQETPLKEEKMKRICVFMNVFNVHINRSPISGVIKKIIYKEGSFFNASLDKASEKNERSSIIISNEKGTEVVVVQIAGLIARRILSFVSKNQDLHQGERYGLIRFGSRVDIYLPKNSIVNCKVGDKVIAGESLLATLAENI